MRRNLLRRMLMLGMLLPLICADACRAETPAAAQANWPRQVVVTVGDIRTRIDGPKLWTLSGIDFQQTMMATEDSAYGMVVTIRNVGHLGTAHFLDVPGKPGELEKEIVTSLQLFVDDEPVRQFAPMMNLDGKSFRMERRSKIRSLDLKSSVEIRDGVLIETAQVRATGPIDLQKAHPWMYAFTPENTVYVFGDEHGIQQRGKFLAPGSETARDVVKNVTWMGAFNPAAGKGTVCYFLKHPPDAEGWFLLIDAPGVYRKLAVHTLVDKVVPAGFEGTYQSAVGFFKATEADWETIALRRAEELEAVRTDE